MTDRAPTNRMALNALRPLVDPAAEVSRRELLRTLRGFGPSSGPRLRDSLTRMNSALTPTEIDDVEADDERMRRSLADAIESAEGRDV